MNSPMELEQRYCAQNYLPLPVVLVRGEGVFVWDDEGNKYLDMMSAYSAVSHGHANPRLVKVVQDQAARLNIVSRAYHTDKLGPFLQRVCELTGMDMALPMNTGAEGVETALKAARKWAVKVKGVPQDAAEIIACAGNFHGRTIAVIAFSSEEQYRDGFGPYPAGFKLAEYGNLQSLKELITPNTAAFLVEPVQGEAGIIVPPDGYLKACEALCRKHNVLLIADEVQTGLGRTGKLLACEHEDVKPDGLILGKALGGGIVPVSMFLAKREVMSVFTPGDHGSTFGGNPLAAAVGLEALNILVEDDLSACSASMGSYMLDALSEMNSPLLKGIRGIGLFVGVEINAALGTARDVCERLMQRGVLSKETHDTVVRLAPPLTITRGEIDWALEQLRTVLDEMDELRIAS